MFASLMALPVVSMAIGGLISAVVVDARIFIATRPEDVVSSWSTFNVSVALVRYAQGAVAGALSGLGVMGLMSWLAAH